MYSWLKTYALTNLPVSFVRRRFSKSISTFTPSVYAENQLLIDVSVISKADAGTGIQRVVRNLYLELLAAPPMSYRVCPIAAARNRGYHYLATDFLSKTSEESALLKTAEVEVRTGDIFLGLDLATSIVPRRLNQLFKWRQHGVRMCFFVYDLLPILEPAWFDPITTRSFRRWLRAIAIVADDIIALSSTVKADFTTQMQRIYGLDERELPCATIRVGVGLDSTPAVQAITQKAVCLPRGLNKSKFILSVGTIEPRKGHADVLDAFEQLWANGDETNLVIVGKQGWHVGKFIHRLKAHPEAGRRLHWLHNADDVVLVTLYQSCSGLIMASKGEGLGLPIVEAIHHSKPVLARDIPVFKEVAGNDASYFPNVECDGLAQVLPHWLAELAARDCVPERFPVGASWRESCRQLLRILLPTGMDVRNR
jgi:glycosyltransferase involved in cell wall biosynthesis